MRFITVIDGIQNHYGNGILLLVLLMLNVSVGRDNRSEVMGKQQVQQLAILLALPIHFPHTVGLVVGPQAVAQLHVKVFVKQQFHAAGGTCPRKKSPSARVRRAGEPAAASGRLAPRLPPPARG